MGDHDMIRAAAAAMSSWWNVAVPPESGSAELSAGFAGWSLAPVATHDHMGDAYRPRSTATTASSESPGSNSFSNSSSVTFQEHANIGDLGLAVPPPPYTGFAEWSQPFLNTTTLHGFLHDGHQDMSTRSDQHHISKSNSQFLSSLQSELLLSPTSPYGVQSSLLRSLVEPMASAATVAPMSRPSPGFQQYQYQQMNQAAPAAATMREPLQLTDEAAPVWNPSVGFGIPTVRPPPAPVSPANLAVKTPLEGVEDAISIIAKKVNTEPAFKKPRIETPSPLPTFKVRKEKLGDRITALQQLVSPFGKTDTASVLHETIEYIKFLHHQVGTLSAPYLKNGHQVPHSKSSTEHKSKDGEGSPERGLRGRGLCLVPISSTFAVASEAPVDFWTPFGATFR